jgi:hypothetical protein
MIEIKCDVYPIKLFVYLGIELEELVKELMVKCPDIEEEVFRRDLGSRGDADGLSVGLGSARYCIWLESYPVDAKLMGILIHELYHTVNDMMRDMDIVFCSKSEEAYAYLLGFLSERIFSEIGFKVTIS